MKAITYNFSIPKYVAAKALGNRFPSMYYGKPSALALKKVREPKLPNEDWIKIKPIYSGLCGSDMGAIFYKTSRSEEHTSELQSRFDLVCRLLLEKKKNVAQKYEITYI